MATSETLKKIIDQKLKENEGKTGRFPFEDNTFKDLYIYVGEEPSIVIEVIDLDKKIYLGKD